ncbi:YpmS family protein [Bacillaceae bacterium SIJ1]|uniref:YpmS family protein n=1 Tax=Litoribacterium kuwaitense TaxID=1398745 RepID=UPI0013EA1860|nr:YpmS family protein [Litoribacterium kuwaitense]NGP44258.1 YpmS family protein [Litoribacterium kuwaitense]
MDNMPTKASRKKPPWKRLFIVLCTLNAGVIVFCLWLFFGPITAPQEREPSPVVQREFYPFTIEASKADLNEVIDTFLEEQTREAVIPYTIRLEENDVRLYGTFKAFGRDVDLLLAFTPRVLPNGDLELHQSVLQVGDLSISVKMVLEYIDRHYALPSWVNVRPDSRVVSINLTEFTSTGGVSFQVEDFNLPDNQIKIQIQVPQDLIQKQPDVSVKP